MLLFVKETVIRGWTVSYEKITCDARLLLQKESIKTIQISLPYISRLLLQKESVKENIIIIIIIIKTASL